MHKENLRNSFLGAILGQPVVHSKILDTSLNPIKEFESLRKVINRRGIEDLMKKISSGEKQPKITNIITKKPLPALEAFVGEHRARISLTSAYLSMLIISRKSNLQDKVV
jgi:hypothetical protein